MSWLTDIRHRHGAVFAAERVLECGAYDINGSPRALFAPGLYVGLDWRPGPGVDVVALVHEYESEPFDTVISTQMLEHDPYWQASVRRMWELVAPGGALILTWASPAVDMHEMHTTPQPGYYNGLTLAQVIGELAVYARCRQVVHDATATDCYLLLAGKLW